MRRSLLLLLALASCANRPSAPPTAAAADADADPTPVTGELVTSNGVALRPPKLVDRPSDGCSGGATIEVPIAIHDRAALTRDPPLTSFLVPFAKQANLRSLDELGVFDEGGRRLPAQIEVLSRWGGAPSDCKSPIRHAYAHVSAVPGPGRSATWKVKSGAKEGEMTTLSLETAKDAWIIDTGAARFTVRRDRFEGLSKVELPNNAGWDVVSQLSAKNGQSSFFLDHGGLRRIKEAEMWRLELERAGPQVVTVVARGYYPGADKSSKRKGMNASRGLGITVRLSFYARSSIVRVEHTYYYGAVAEWSATGLTNTTVVQRAWMSVPLSEPAVKIYARADGKIHTLDPTAIVQVEQQKRAPDRPDLAYAVHSGERSVESGERARKPFLAALGKRFYVMATIARMAEREPQGFTWSDQLNALDVDFTSAPIQIGGARGIWSVAALDFGRGTPSEARVDAMQLFAERPLLGAPLPSYLNGTGTIGPYATDTKGAAGQFADVVKKLHQGTKDYLQRLRITGLQVWPDLPANSCEVEYNCPAFEKGYYSGGANNYWNWSKPAFDEFFRTAEGDLIHDFPLGEAMQYVETIAVRPDHHWLGDSSVAGLAPCYGDATGYDGAFIEGTNNRRDRCPADYSYDKTLELAFLATGDMRFVDFFEEAGVGAVNIFGAPPKVPQPYLELNLSRLSTQRLELLADGAEFARDPTVGELLRSKLRAYADHMVGRTLIDGHACEMGGTGHNDVAEIGECNSVVGWLLPVAIAWVVRTAQLLDHEPLRKWVAKHAAVSAKHHTGAEQPGSARREWRVGYTCKVSKQSAFGACKQWSGGENDARFYNNGIIAYLNVFGLILAADPSDPSKICKWLPSAYQSQMSALGFEDLNGFIWGKGSGQALAMSGEAVGAINACK